MIKIPMDICLKTLDGYINDEDKLVTYKWLSNELEVHVNVAKQILETYWNEHKNDDIVATIMLIGFLKDGEMRVELVKDCDLAVAMKKFSKIISQHIYSLQKTLSDIELLAGIGPGDVKYGAIYCENSVLLSDEELFARRWGAATMFQAPPEKRKPPVDRAADAKKSGIGKFLKESTENKKSTPVIVTNKQEEKLEEKKISSPKSKLSPKKGANSKKNVQSMKTGFKNLFGKISATNQKKSSSNSNTPSVLTEKKAEPVKKDVIKKDSSAENPVLKKSDKLVFKEKSPKEEISSKKERFSNENASPKDEPEKIVEQSTSKEKKLFHSKISEPKGNNNKKIKQGTKRDRSQELKLDAKKRKRIVVASDTSDESAESEEEEEVIYDSPPREQIIEKPKSQTAPLVQNINGRRKIRKMVDKTFMDEDGYLVTKMEQVYESCSDEEEEEPVKVPESKPTVTQPPSRIIKKQTTLMSFFKKS